MSKAPSLRHCEPICVECGGLGVLTSGLVVYPRLRYLHRKWFYCCPCGAKVGCHPETTISLGRPCGKDTAKARQEAHLYFDTLWRAKEAGGTRRSQARAAAYKWLAEQLGISADECHMSRMDMETALRAAEVCRPHYQRIVARAPEMAAGGR